MVGGLLVKLMTGKLHRSEPWQVKTTRTETSEVAHDAKEALS